MLIEVVRATEDGHVHPEGHMWVWRIFSRNGRLIGQAPKPYVRKSACEEIAHQIAEGITRISVES